MPPSFSGKTTLVSGNVTIAGHRTSLRLEPEMWAALRGICARERLSIHVVCTMVDQRRNGTSLTSAVRTFMVNYYEKAATEDGHERAGHGNGDPFGWGPILGGPSSGGPGLGQEQRADEELEEEPELETEEV